jgi:beta-lactamase regulating signal transducer with metallopeptidase domain/protocatechuate 3,4-dioxygenase beta subunit
MNAMILDILARSPREALALDVALKATLVLAAAGVAALALRRSSAAARHLAWCLGLAGALALPVLGLILPGWSWRVLPISAGTGRAPRAEAPAPPASRTAWATPASSALDERALDEDALAGIAPAAHASRPAPASPIAPPSGRWWGYLTPSWTWLWAAWLAGALAVVSRSLAGWIAVRRLSRESRPIDDAGWNDLVRELSIPLGLSRRILLLRSERAVMPMTWSWTRPVILLPSDADSWDDARRRAVLLHELAHVVRLDCPTQALARLACAVYWFHPLAWLAERRMRVERERACDDVVLLAGARASEYATHLLETARGLRVPRAAALAATAMARPSQLEGRLMAILDPARRRVGPGRKPAAIALVTAMIALVPLAMLRVGARAAGPMPPSSDLIADDRPAADPAGRMTVTGRVLDPSGKPVPNAAVMAIVHWMHADRPRLNDLFGPMTDHHGRCDSSGRFRIEMPRTTSARHDRLTLTALAPGYGIGWAELDPDAEAPDADVTLRPEQIVRGRLFDLKGQPAPGVALAVRTASRVMPGEARVRPELLRPDELERPWRDLPAWPGPAISDAEGRFTLRGLGRGLSSSVGVDDPRFALGATMIQTDTADVRLPFSGISVIKIEPGPDPKPIAITLQPARTLSGRVTFADTGRPVPHATVVVLPYRLQADGEGRFRAPASSSEGFQLMAQSPGGAPYLNASKPLRWPKGAVEQSVDLALARGVVVRGKVTEEGTGRPIAGAIVRVAPYQIAAGSPYGLGAPEATGRDGTYEVAAPPGPGFLVVQGPDEDYVLREIGADGGYFTARPGRERHYAHAYRAVDLKLGEPDTEVDVTLRRGAAVPVRIIDPDGRPVRDALAISRVILEAQPTGGWRIWRATLASRGPGRVRDGRFALHRLDPETEVPAYFLDPERKLGATARFSGRSAADGPITVRLDPCGTARARLVTPDGKPIDRYPAGDLMTMIVTPGPPSRRNPSKGDPLFADEGNLYRLDPVNYPRDFQTDAAGHVTFRALIPGATYRIVDQTPIIGGGNPELRKEFTVKPGEILDLGNILVARPRGRD